VKKERKETYLGEKNLSKFLSGDKGFWIVGDVEVKLKRKAAMSFSLVVAAAFIR